MLSSIIAPLWLATASSHLDERRPFSLGDTPPLVPEAIEEVIVDRDRYERMTIPVTIAGVGPYRFLIDTGAQATVVTPAILADLRLRPSGTAMLVAMGSSAVVPLVDLDGLTFANRELNGIRAPLLDRSNIGADGILGLDSLQGLRVLMDFEEDRIAVASSKELGGNSGFEIVVRARRLLGQMIITDAEINGIRTNVIVDTGAQRSFANAHLQARLKSRDREREVATDVHGFEMKSEVRRTRALRIGGIALEGLTVGYVASPVFAALGLDDGPALVLGIGDLRSFRRVAIDFEEGAVLFDLPRKIARDFRRHDFFSRTMIRRAD